MLLVLSLLSLICALPLLSAGSPWSHFSRQFVRSHTGTTHQREGRFPPVLSYKNSHTSRSKRKTKRRFLWQNYSRACSSHGDSTKNNQRERRSLPLLSPSGFCLCRPIRAAPFIVSRDPSILAIIYSRLFDARSVASPSLGIVFAGERKPILTLGFFFLLAPMLALCGELVASPSPTGKAASPQFLLQTLACCP